MSERRTVKRTDPARSELPGLWVQRESASVELAECARWARIIDLKEPDGEVHLVLDNGVTLMFLDRVVIVHPDRQ